jgi:hypothetical protein
MQRRQFLESVAGANLAAALSQAADAPEKRTRFYLLQQFHLKNGTQKSRLDEYLSSGLLPVLGKLHTGPVLCLEGVVAPHLPQMIFLAGYRTLEEMREVQAALTKDEGHQKALATWEHGAEQPYEDFSTSLLGATDYSPEITPLKPQPKTPRIFELRVYHSPTRHQLAALHERFAGPEIQIFQRSGVHPVLYTSTIFGANMPNLTYLIPFADLAAREKAWAAFGADPEWVKVRKESIDRNGQISISSQISLYRATPYSPLR